MSTCKDCAVRGECEKELATVLENPQIISAADVLKPVIYQLMMDHHPLHILIALLLEAVVLAKFYGASTHMFRMVVNSLWRRVPLPSPEERGERETIVLCSDGTVN